MMRQRFHARAGEPCSPWIPAFEALEGRDMLTAGTGLSAQYFGTERFDNLIAERIDARIDFDWSSSPPAENLPADAFSVRWFGQVEATKTETHTFYLTSNDGARLWVNGTLLFDQFDAAGLQTHQANIDLIAGRRYDIQVEYRDQTADASIRLDWSSPTLPRHLVPTERLFPTPRNFRFQAPNRAMLHVPETGRYQFYLTASDATTLWLSNTTNAEQKREIASVRAAVPDGNWTFSPSQQSAPLHLVGGQSYYLEATSVATPADVRLSIGWKTPSNSNIQAIPSWYLSPIVPQVRLYAEQPTTAEGASPAVLTVVRAGASNDVPLNVRYRLTGTAINGTDYVRLAESITIPAGADSVTIQVTGALDDDSNEGEEHAIVELLSDVTYDVGLTSERVATVKVQDNAQAPEGGTSLLRGNLLGSFVHFGGEFLTVADPEFSSIIETRITDIPPNFYDAQLQQSIALSARENDLLLLEFYVRSVAQPGKVTLVFETNGPPYDQSLTIAVPVTPAWQKIQIPFLSIMDYEAGRANLSFQMGHQRQTLQFANIRLLNYGSSGDILHGERFTSQNLDGNFGVTQNVTVSGQEFTTAYEMKTMSKPPFTYQFQIYARSRSTLSAGERMRVEFWARSITNAPAKLETVVLRTSNFSSLGSTTSVLGFDWRKFDLEVQAYETFHADQLQLNFHAGFDPQTVQIGGIAWTNRDRHQDVQTLPLLVPSTSYGGRSGRSDWRAEADSRIRDSRAAEMTVRVIDNNGVPVEAAVVHTRQQSHAFLFGAAVNGFDNRLSSNNATTESLKYQSEVKRLFNAVTDEYALQWIPLSQDLQRGFSVANFAKENDLYMRGHSGIWPSRTYMPENVWSQYDALLTSQSATAARSYLRNAAIERISLIASTFANVTDEWDVVNEPRANHEVMDVLGDQVLVDWFRTFRELDPTAKLSLNEYGLFTDNGANADNWANFQYWVSLLTAHSLLDVQGEQSHFDAGNLTDIPVLARLISDLRSRNDLPIVISEFDVNTKDLQLQADYLRDYLTMAFSQKAVDKFIQWGFWEGRHWLPDAALYRIDFSIKPNGQAYEDLVFGRWWTDERGTTRHGSMTTRAFLGDYAIEIDYGGQTFRSSYSHGGQGEVLIRLPITSNVTGDFSGDGLVNDVDIDILGQAIDRSLFLSNADLNQDGTINQPDLDFMIEEIIKTRNGDCNLDGRVAFDDFLLLSANFGRTEDSSWKRGDFDLDRRVDFEDFLALSANFGFDRLSPPMTVIAVMNG